MRFLRILILTIGLSALCTAFGEYVCTERVFLNANEEEVFSKYPDMIEVSIFALLAQPDYFDGNAITVRGQLTSIDSFYVLVPPDAPRAKYIPFSSIRINLNKPTACFLEQNQNEMVVVRGRFRRDDHVLAIDDAYYMARLRIED